MVQKHVLLLLEDDLPLVNQHHIVGDFLDIRGDMGGEEHGMLLILDKIQQDVQNLVPDHRVQARRGLVQNQQPGPVGQGGGNGQLHLHALGEGLDPLPLRQGETL